MDIKSKEDYPANEITNFAAHYFEIDGVKCASMEGFLQSLKTSDIKKQIEVCKLIGIEAKRWGEEYSLLHKKTPTLWWQGNAYNRHGNEYLKLLDRAYEALFQNKNFKKALLATGQEILTHSIGKSDPKDTILTEEEFCSRLMHLRERMNIKQ